MATPQAVRQFLSSIGKKGGRARIRRLSPKKRHDLARTAARARWRRARAKKARNV